MQGDHMESLEVQFFGRLKISYAGQVLTSFRTLKTQALLLYLLADPAKARKRSHLSELFWPGLPTKSARGNLRSTLYFARQLIRDALHTEGEYVQINPESPITSDIATLNSHLQAVDGHSHTTVEECDSCTELLKKAIGLARGEFAAGFSLDDSNQFEDWLFLQRDKLKRLLLSTYDALVKNLLAQKLSSDAAQYAQERLAQDLLSEEGYRQAMQVYLHDGKRLDGLKLYDRCKQMLKAEWGIVPSAETEAIVKQLRMDQKPPRVVLPKQPSTQPFSAGPPISDPKRFFGRKRELKRIDHWLQNRPMSHIAIIGQRRSGKTSLLHHLQHKHPKFRWVWVDFQDPRMRQLTSLLPYLIRQFGLPDNEVETLESFMDAIGTHQWQQPIIVLMDELGAGLSAPDLTQEFWWMLRALVNSAETSPLAFIVAAHDSPILLAEEEQKTSPFFNIFSTLTLGPLTKNEANKLIDSSNRRFPDDDRAWILAESQQWPILLQILCEECLYALEGNDPEWQTTALARIEPYRYLLI